MKERCDCDCCAGVESSTPQPVENRPGLPQVRYRAGEYAHFRASMLAALTSGNRPALAGLTTRDDEDLTIALLDATACMADVLTFYNERLVNEAYLRTARDRLSLAELGKLIGYRLRPGVAAATYLAFHVEPPPPAAVDAATSPFRKVRIPSSVTIPAGVAVRSIPGPGEQQQVFETSEAIEARPEWNLMRPVTTKAPVVGSPAKALYVKGTATNLKPGDMLLFSGAAGWEARPIATVTPQNALDRTLVTWKEALAKAVPLTPYVMRKRLNIFGYNAPLWRSMSDEFKKSYGCATGCSDWPRYWITVLPDDPSKDTSWYLKADLDGSHPDLAGSHIILAVGNNLRHFTVGQLVELSRAEFSISGKATRVTLQGDFWEWLWYFIARVRETTVYAASEELVLADEPLTTSVQGGQVVVTGNVTALPPGRALLVAAGGKIETAYVKETTATGPNTTLTLMGDLANSYDRANLAVFGNVVKATNGETVHQILGDGQAARPFQRFELKHAPLAHVPSEDPSGSTSTLEVWVNDVAWHEVPTLYRAKPGDRVFVTRDNASGAVEVGTGDGLRGARVPTGQHNVRAMYRKGAGAGGNLPAGALTQLGSPPLGVTGVTNPVPAVGGADPDSADHARSGIPLSTRTLGRAVSLTDYADFARTFAGIAKAHATVLSVRNVRTIVVTVAGEKGEGVAEEVRNRLATSLRGHGDPLAPVLVVPHRHAPFALRMKIRRHPDHELDTVRKAVAAELSRAFGFDARELLQPVQRSEVLAAAHRAAGVVALDLDYLWRASPVANNKRLLAEGPIVFGPQVYGAELLLLTTIPLTWLTELP